MKKALLFSLLIVFSTKLSAQQLRVFEQYSLGYAFSKKASAPTLMYSQKLLMGKKNNFAIGSGVRMTRFSGKDKIFTGIDKKNTNTTITVLPRATMTAFNIPLIAEYNGKKVIAGFNIDLMGLTFGKKRDSLIVKNYVGPSDSLTVKPAGFNFLLGSKGTTNNEVYVGFKIQEEIIVRAGFSFLFTQYSTRYTDNGKESKLGSFRYNPSAMPFISIIFNFEK